MKLNTTNTEVLVSTSHPIDFLQNTASLNVSKKSRICSHKNIDQKLHEMFITHAKDYYVRPHRHFNKSESILILKGNADLVLFNDKGDIDNVVKLDEFSSGENFYHRIDLPIYHSIIIKSKYLVFYEVTTGPLKQNETEFASWSPEINSQDVDEFMNNMYLKVKQFN